jgi:hypothetical protein
MVRLGKAILRSLVFIAFPVVQALFENWLMIYEFAPPRPLRLCGELKMPSLLQ